jgi:tetratricopeptide (TPR) repeat protein
MNKVNSMTKNPSNKKTAQKANEADTSSRRFYGFLITALVVVNLLFFWNLMQQQPELTPEQEQGYALANEAVSYFDAGNYEQAIASYSDAMRYLPDDAGLYYNRALAHLAREDQASAIADLQTTIEKDANYAPPYLVLGDIYDGNAEYAEALEAYQQYESLANRQDQDVARIVIRIAELEQLLEE